MRQTYKNGPRLLALAGTLLLLSAPALAESVTVYGGGKSKTYSSQERVSPVIIAGGENRETAFEKRVQRFATERKVQSILEDRDTEEARETSDAMMRVILRGNRDAQKNYSRYYPYHARSADFYARLEQTMREQKAGIRVYRQSVLDDVSSEDLQRVAKAMNDLN